MRDLEFRAWDKTNRIMLSNIDCVNLQELKAGILQEGDDIESQIEVDFMQYTGLKDKNGVKIFEGDKVRILYTDWVSQHRGTKKQKEMTLDEYKISISYYGTVIFDDLQFMLDIGYLHCGRYGEIEVIGNIYEDKENGK